MSLDVLRALVKSQGQSLSALHKDIHSKTEAAGSHAELMQSADRLRQSANQIVEFASKNTDQLELAARDFAFSLARTFMGE